MPAKSEAQRRWAFGRMGEKWARKHHYANKGKLPARAKKRKHSALKRIRKRRAKHGKGR